jgi:competence/damage-inducible protein CinA-like protein
MVEAEILSQGDEVITGQTVDSNAAWLAQQLTVLGIRVVRHSSVGDDAAAIAGLVAEAATRVQLVLCSGGLGPTADDLTAVAVAAAADLPLRFDAEAMAQIERLYRRFGKPMAATNRKQAMLPLGSQRLDNRWGTAPGFALELHGAWLAFMPGVPREMRKMFGARVLPELQRRFVLQPGHLITLRTVGVGESRLQQLLAGWQHDSVSLGYRARAPEVQVKLRFPPGFSAPQRDALADTVAQPIGIGVYCREGYGRDTGPQGELGEVVLQLLGGQGLTLAVAEQGAGGVLAAMLHGASVSLQAASAPPSALRCSRVCAADGPASGQQASALAAAALADSGCDLGLGLSLQSDPRGDQPGSAWAVLASADGVRDHSFKVAGGRALMQTLAAGAAMDFVRRRLLER